MKKPSSRQLLTAFFLIVFAITSSATYSQEKRKILEISTSTFDQFNIRYKFGNEKMLFRLTSYDLSLSSNKQSETDNHSNFFKIGAGFGLEFSKQINEKFALYYGPELRGKFLNANDGSNQQEYSFSLNAILGFKYLINEHLKLGAELSPGFYYCKHKENEVYSDQYAFNILDYTAEIVLGFCF